MRTIADGLDLAEVVVWDMTMLLPVADRKLAE
jgi:hypothetical protein